MSGPDGQGRGVVMSDGGVAGVDVARANPRGSAVSPMIVTAVGVAHPRPPPTPGEPTRSASARSSGPISDRARGRGGRGTGEPDDQAVATGQPGLDGDRGAGAATGHVPGAAGRDRAPIGASAAGGGPSSRAMGRPGSHRAAWTTARAATGSRVPKVRAESLARAMDPDPLDLRSGQRRGVRIPHERVVEQPEERSWEAARLLDERAGDVVGGFPDRGAIIRRVGAVLTEDHEGWMVGRHSMGVGWLRAIPAAVPDQEVALGLPHASSWSPGDTGVVRTPIDRRWPAAHARR